MDRIRQSENSEDSKKNGTSTTTEKEDDPNSQIDLQKEVWDSTAVDPVLARKMALINDAIDEIGLTPWHWKLFFLNGFGYMVDSLLVVCQAITQPAVMQEFIGNPAGRLQSVALASQIGLFVGAAVWGLTADVVGRKLAFNSSLLICAIFVLIAGGMPGYVSFCAMVAIYSAAAGGNYILDATNFLEFLPRTHAWLVTFLAIWVPIGYCITGLLAWAFMSNFSCAPNATVEQCTRADNWGWRYLHFTAGGLVLVCSLIRVFIIRMVQTPKWLISQNRDDEAFSQLLGVSQKYNRPFSLQLETLQSQGRILHTEKSIWSSMRLKAHVAGLFATRRLGYSTSVIIANWFVIGMVAPLYQVFLPYYLKSRGAELQTPSNYILWRNYAIAQSTGIAGPIIAAVLVELPYVGRKGTLAVGALTTMALDFGYTQITTPTQNLALSSSINVATNIYYGTIYAYTPEVLPSAHRATGYGVCMMLNRIGGICGVIVGSYANVETTAPLFVCAGLYGLLIVLSLMLPFESRGRRSV